MKKRIVTLLLAALMVFTLAACQENPAEPTNAPATGAPATQAPTDAPAPAGDIVDIVMVGYTSSPSMNDFQMVVDAINEILIRDVNVRLTLDVGVSFSNYMEQMNLRFAAQEKMDWVLSGTHYNFPDSIVKGYFEPLNDLIEADGQNIVDIITYDYLEAASSGGEIFGIPQRRDLAAASSGILYRKDILEANNLTLDGVEHTQDFASIFETIHAADPERTMYYSGPPTGPLKTFFPFCDIDNLGSNDDISILYPFDGTEVKLLPETDEYRAAAAMVREWYANGWLFSDAATDTTPGGDYMKNDRIFAYNNTYHANALTQCYQHTGFEDGKLGVIQTSTMKATTSTVNVFLWAMPSWCENPEVAMQFLNYMYGSEEIINLLVWGIEGTHYVWDDNHEFIRYPDGITRDNLGYRLGTAWLWGDQFKNHVFEGGNPTAWQEMDADNRSAKFSDALGFMFDVTPVKNEYTAVINVYNEFAMAISCGIAPESAVDDYVAKMKAAGAEAVLAAKQSQIADWLATRA
ncbi:ABC transporter substrate-binding protein [Oscillospiraceae bacterium OttesenSCG-928-F05]|nr:ABC transporter substrate-binding protein [Oscillospiraceae bacterium OttesenSCG-928-F05]